MTMSIWVISSVVFAAHVCLLVSLFFVPLMPPVKATSRRPLVVHSVALQANSKNESALVNTSSAATPPISPQSHVVNKVEQTSAPKVAKPVTKASAAEPKKEDKPAPKDQANKSIASASTKAGPVAAKTPPKVVAKKAPTPPIQSEKKPQTVTKDSSAKAKAQKRKELLAQAQEKMGQLQVMSEVKVNSLGSAKALPVMATDNVSASAATLSQTGPAGYREALASRLQSRLQLPEFGTVEIRLTLTSSGAVAKLEIVHADSSLNRQYIEQAIAGMSFQPFDASFDGLQQYTFHIQLK